MQWRRLAVVVTRGAWPLWLFIGVGIAIWCVSYLAASCPEEHILYGGMLFTLAGILTVAKGIADLRKRFNLRTTGESLREWWRQVKAAIRPPVISGTFKIPNMESATTMGDIILVAQPPMSLEQRVEALEKAVADHREESTQQINAVRAEVGRVEVLVHKEGANRHQGDADLLKTIEEVAVGGIRIEVLGLVWLVLGTLGTSIPKVIADHVPKILVM